MAQSIVDAYAASVAERVWAEPVVQSFRQLDGDASLNDSVEQGRYVQDPLSASLWDGSDTERAVSPGAFREFGRSLRDVVAETQFDACGFLWQPHPRVVVGA